MVADTKVLKELNKNFRDGITEGKSGLYVF